MVVAIGCLRRCSRVARVAQVARGRAKPLGRLAATRATREPAERPTGQLT